MANKTLFDLTYETARALGAITEGTATGGSTTTLIDTVERTEDDDFWNGGTVWINYDAGGGGAAPQGEFSSVTDFVSSTKTATLRTTLTAAIASGDRYTIARTRYPLHILISKVNEVLTQIPIVKVDITTVVITADTLTYTLPADVYVLKEVWIETDDSDEYGWKRLYDWTTEEQSVGAANLLILNHYYDVGTAIKLVYLTYHPTLRAAPDKLDDTIHSNRVIYSACVSCLLWRKAKVGESDSSINEMLNYFQMKANEANAQFALDYPKRSAKTISINFERPLSA